MLVAVASTIHPIVKGTQEIIWPFLRPSLSMMYPLKKHPNAKGRATMLAGIIRKLKIMVFYEMGLGKWNFVVRTYPWSLFFGNNDLCVFVH